MKIRTEITLTGSGSGGFHPLKQLDNTKYSGTVTYYFEVLGNTNNLGTGNILLRRNGTSTDDASCSFANSISNQLVRSAAFTPPAGQTEYILATSGAITATAVRASIIIIQDSTPLTSTQHQIDLVSDNANNTSVTSTTGAIPNQMYFNYNSADWDGTLAAKFEAVLNVNITTKVTGTATLQVADGTGDGFVGWADVTNATVSTTSLTAVRVRAASSFTLTSGRNYRVVFKTSNSKTAMVGVSATIIIDQTDANITKLRPSYLFLNSAFAGTSLAASLVKWDSAEWDTTNVYKFVVDAADNSTSVVALKTSDDVTTVGTVTSPDNQGSSSALTMPSNQNLDVKATTNNSDLWGTRIIVFAVKTVAVTPSYLGGPTMMFLGVGLMSS